MGVWVETEDGSIAAVRISSIPVWGCGLKQRAGSSFAQTNEVHPRMGVWVETRVQLFTVVFVEVHPRMGVWVETASSPQLVMRP